MRVGRSVRLRFGAFSCGVKPRVVVSCRIQCLAYRDFGHIAFFHPRPVGEAWEVRGVAARDARKPHVEFGSEHRFHGVASHDVGVTFLAESPFVEDRVFGSEHSGWVADDRPLLFLCHDGVLAFEDGARIHWSAFRRVFLLEYVFAVWGVAVKKRSAAVLLACLIRSE